MKSCRYSLLSAALLAITGCGDDGGSSDNTPDAAGGTGGDANTGGVAATGGLGSIGGMVATGGVQGGGGSGDGSGGAATGGTQSTGGTGADGATLFDPASRCSPGTYLQDGLLTGGYYAEGGGVLCNEMADRERVFAATGITPDNSLGFVKIHSLLYPSPMTPGVEAALALEIENISDGEGRNEATFWASSGHCAEGGQVEKFYTGTVHYTETHCASFTPGYAFTHVLIITRDIVEGPGGYSLGGATLCSAGSCPTP